MPAGKTKILQGLSKWMGGAGTLKRKLHKIIDQKTATSYNGNFNGSLPVFFYKVNNNNYPIGKL